MKSIPYSQDAEKALLGSLLLSERATAAAVEAVSPDDFHEPRHRQIFQLITSQWITRKPIDFITLGQAAERQGILADIGGNDYLTELFGFVPTASNWKEYAGTIREKAFARRAIEEATEILEHANDPTRQHDLAEIVQAALVRIAGFSESKAQTKTIKDILARRLDYFEEIARGGSRLEGLSTGIKPLDRAIRGLRPGNMIVIAAPTKGGKTALALNIAQNVALSGHAVGIFSLEMNEGELADRFIASRASVDLSAVMDGGLSQSSVSRLLAAINELSGTKVFVRDESVLAPLQFRAAARKLVAQHQCKLIVLDYLQLMTPGSRDDNRERQVAECSRTIKTTAAELGIPVIVMSQLNDSGRARESRAIEQDCNVFLAIEEEEGKHFLNIKYARDCARSRIPMDFHREFTRFAAKEKL